MPKNKEPKPFKKSDQTWCRICYGTFPPELMFKWSRDGEARLGPICAFCTQGLHSEIQQSGILEK